MLDVEKKNNPNRKLEAIQRKERLDNYKEKLDTLLNKREFEVKQEISNIDREWKVYEHLKQEKEEIRDRARRVISEQER